MSEVENHLQFLTNNSLYAWSPSSGKGYRMLQKNGGVSLGKPAEEVDAEHVVFVTTKRARERVAATLERGARYEVEQLVGKRWMRVTCPAKLDEALQTRLKIVDEPRRAVARIFAVIKPRKPEYVTAYASGQKGDSALLVRGYLGTKESRSMLTSPLVSNSGYTNFNPA